MTDYRSTINLDFNYFSLLPGEKKEVRMSWKDEDTRGNEGKVLITGYNVE